MARAQGEAKAFRYLLHLPDSIKGDVAELNLLIQRCKREIEELRADAGRNAGEDGSMDFGAADQNGR